MQKILYIHPPLAYGAYLGFVVTAVAGGLFLWRERETHDQLAIAGAEVGTVFCTLMLITGPIWARGAWGPGNWWVWDARLTLTLLLWFVYLAYLLLRSLCRFWIFSVACAPRPVFYSEILNSVLAPLTRTSRRA